MTGVGNRCGSPSPTASPHRAPSSMIDQSSVIRRDWRSTASVTDGPYRYGHNHGTQPLLGFWVKTHKQGAGRSRGLSFGGSSAAIRVSLSLQLQVLAGIRALPPLFSRAAGFASLLVRITRSMAAMRRRSSG